MNVNFLSASQAGRNILGNAHNIATTVKNLDVSKKFEVEDDFSQSLDRFSSTHVNQKLDFHVKIRKIWTFPISGGDGGERGGVEEGDLGRGGQGALLEWGEGLVD